MDIKMCLVRPVTDVLGFKLMTQPASRDTRFIIVRFVSALGYVNFVSHGFFSP